MEGYCPDLVRNRFYIGEAGLATTMGNVQSLQSKVRLASVSRTGCLAKPDFKPAAARFMRWRKKHWKLKKPKRVRYWQSRKPV
jgi:hypothetical protein